LCSSATTSSAWPPHSGAAQTRANESRPDRLDTRTGIGSIELPQQPAGLDRGPGRAHAVTLADLQDRAGDRRVEVKMLVRIDMVERQSGLGESGELGLDLGMELRSRGGRGCHGERSAQHRIVEASVGPDQSRDLLRRQRRSPVDQDQV
jgi:hypothetical protein